MMILCPTEDEIPRNYWKLSQSVEVIGVGRECVPNLKRLDLSKDDLVLMLGICGARSGVDIDQLVTPISVTYKTNEIKIDKPYDHQSISQFQFGTYDSVISKESELRDGDIIVDQESYHILSILHCRVIIIRSVSDIITKNDVIDQHRLLTYNFDMSMYAIERFLCKLDINSFRR